MNPLTHVKINHEVFKDQNLTQQEKNMLYFGNLTDQVNELDEIEKVTILALPYCPANKKWIQHSQYLIGRFNPQVTLVHHFDNFSHPFTASKYMNLDQYRKAIHEEYPEATLFFSKFYTKLDFNKIAGKSELN